MAPDATPEIPSVKVLAALKPANSGTGDEALVYNDLAAAVERCTPTNAIRARNVWAAMPETLDEISKARQLASEYLVRTAYAVVMSKDVRSRNLWADRFTRASIERFGAPDPAEVTGLITSEYDELVQMKDRNEGPQGYLDFLLDIYRPIIGTSWTRTDSATTEIAREKEAVQEYGREFLGAYLPLFDMVDAVGLREFTAAGLREIFAQLLDWLQDNDDAAWGEWQIIDDAEATSLSVAAASHQIKIPSSREPASLMDTRGLVAHELLVHALRGKNGYKTGDGSLATGLPGYLDAEEGLGILSEEAVNGELPERVYDRYLDIALALGTCGGVQRTRRELFEISFARQVLRQQRHGTFNDADMGTLERKVWRHVDRIYRGGPGDNMKARQAIFTKDITYYIGYKKMAQYIRAQLDSGKSTSEIFAYLSQGKFDPTNPQHVERLLAASR